MCSKYIQMAAKWIALVVLVYNIQLLSGLEFVERSSSRCSQQSQSPPHQLDCPRGAQIVILRTSVGSKRKTVLRCTPDVGTPGSLSCCHPDMGDCVEENSAYLDHAQTQCDGKTTCQLVIETQGNMGRCTDDAVYLKATYTVIQYTCIPDALINRAEWGSLFTSGLNKETTSLPREATARVLQSGSGISPLEGDDSSALKGEASFIDRDPRVPENQNPAPGALTPHQTLISSTPTQTGPVTDSITMSMKSKRTNSSNYDYSSAPKNHSFPKTDNNQKEATYTSLTERQLLRATDFNKTTLIRTGTVLIKEATTKYLSTNDFIITKVLPSSISRTTSNSKFSTTNHTTNLTDYANIDRNQTTNLTDYTTIDTNLTDYANTDTNYGSNLRTTLKHSLLASFGDMSERQSNGIHWSTTMDVLFQTKTPIHEFTFSKTPSLADVMGEASRVQILHTWPQTYQRRSVYSEMFNDEVKNSKIKPHIISNVTSPAFLIHSPLQSVDKPQQLGRTDPSQVSRTMLRVKTNDTIVLDSSTAFLHKDSSALSPTPAYVSLPIMAKATGVHTITPPLRTDDAVSVSSFPVLDNPVTEENLVIPTAMEETTSLLFVTDSRTARISFHPTVSLATDTAEAAPNIVTRDNFNIAASHHINIAVSEYSNTAASDHHDNAATGHSNIAASNYHNISVSDHSNIAASDHRDNAATSHSNIAASHHINIAVRDHSNTAASDHRDNAATSHSNIAASHHINIAVRDHSNTAASDHRDNATGHSNIAASDHHNISARDHLNTAASDYSNIAASDHRNIALRDIFGTAASEHRGFVAVDHFGREAGDHLGNVVSGHFNVAPSKHFDIFTNGQSGIAGTGHFYITTGDRFNTASSYHLYIPTNDRFNVGPSNHLHISTNDRFNIAPSEHLHIDNSDRFNTVYSDHLHIAISDQVGEDDSDHSNITIIDQSDIAASDYILIDASDHFGIAGAQLDIAVSDHFSIAGDHLDIAARGHFDIAGSGHFDIAGSDLLSITSGHLRIAASDIVEIVDNAHVGYGPSAVLRNKYIATISDVKTASLSQVPLLMGDSLQTGPAHTSLSVLHLFPSPSNSVRLHSLTSSSNLIGKDAARTYSQRLKPTWATTVPTASIDWLSTPVSGVSHVPRLSVSSSKSNIFSFSPSTSQYKLSSLSSVSISLDVQKFVKQPISSGSFASRPTASPGKFPQVTSPLVTTPPVTSYPVTIPPEPNPRGTNPPVTTPEGAPKSVSDVTPEVENETGAKIGMGFGITIAIVMFALLVFVAVAVIYNNCYPYSIGNEFALLDTLTTHGLFSNRCDSNYTEMSA